MVDRPGILLRGVPPRLEHFENGEVVLVYETGIDHLAFQICQTLGNERRRNPFGRNRSQMESRVSLGRLRLDDLETTFRRFARRTSPHRRVRVKVARRAPGIEIASSKGLEEALMKMSLRLAAILALMAACSQGAPAQTPSTGRVMREKLTHSQNILEAIMTSDFALLQRESAEIEKATESPAWSVFNSPEYQRQTCGLRSGHPGPRRCRESPRPGCRRAALHVADLELLPVPSIHEEHAHGHAVAAGQGRA